MRDDSRQNDGPTLERHTKQCYSLVFLVVGDSTSYLLFYVDQLLNSMVFNFGLDQSAPPVLVCMPRVGLAFCSCWPVLSRPLLAATTAKARRAPVFDAGDPVPSTSRPMCPQGRPAAGGRRLQDWLPRALALDSSPSSHFMLSFFSRYKASSGILREYSL